MKRIKVIVCALLATLVIFSPFVMVLSVAIFAPPQYENTFIGELSAKYERLNSIEEPKIVVIGGSSVAFGIDSALIEKYTKMPVVNFGLYATLGTKLMLDLSRSAIGKDDIVIIAPELNEQTYSLYFNAESTLQALDGNFSMIKDIDSENYSALFGAMWDFAQDKIGYIIDEDAPDPTGVYNSKNFNEYGDLDWDRDENIMPGYFDENVTIDPDTSIITDEFVNYLNDYAVFCRERGASVYFAFCPMNEMGVVSGKTEADFSRFQSVLETRLNFKVVTSDINRYVYDAGYFYDTNFHLNDAGAKCHTLNLLSDVLFELSIPALLEDPPAPPELPGADVLFRGEDENSKYFTYEKAQNGAYVITGLSDIGKSCAMLTVPLGYNGYKVMYIGEGAFADGVMCELIITEDTNLRVIKNGAFRGAGALTDLWIYYPKEEDILPPNDFAGVSSDFVVHVPEDSYYESGYYWSERGLVFERIIEK